MNLALRIAAQTLEGLLDGGHAQVSNFIGSVSPSEFNFR
jgi:hypothetical protein